jgi:hypothetical protein
MEALPERHLGIRHRRHGSQQLPEYLRALPETATYFGYSSLVGIEVRSNVVYGFVQVNNTAYQSNSTYHKAITFAGNLIWNPFGSLNLGSRVSLRLGEEQG